MAKKSKNQNQSNVIAQNKKARHDYFIEQTFEAGVVLEGWEVRSIRDGKVHLVESYVYLKDGEVFISGMQIHPLLSASTHVIPHPTRIRKLLLHNREISRLIGQVERKGYTLVPLKLYWKKQLVKLEIALAKGKHLHDKRASLKEKEWNRDKQRLNKLR
ncbi:MAG: SsrA-binding protein [Kangiellaceae bacterium]|jgi:SsrA-binding protein|nr:SsrA-binding protein [Kangiellaceae bacterium]|tara:strand:+ start:1819 stop:2295 length:477 start_codon:yes stop_codon:yes gene_type:complete